MSVAVQASARGQSLLKVLIDTPYLLVKSEVDDMTLGEAQGVWSHLEPLFPGVCARASTRKRDQRWLLLVRKMQLIKRKAKEV